MRLKVIIVAVLTCALVAGTGYYFYKTNIAKPDLVSQYSVSNDAIAQDLEGRTAPLPYGQVWPFEPKQGLTVKVIAKKQVEDYIVIVVEIKATADVTPPKTDKKEEKPPPAGIKSFKVGLQGLAKLTYEKINHEWYLIGVESVSLRAYPLVEQTDTPANNLQHGQK